MFEVQFLGNEYNFSDELITYVQYLKNFESYNVKIMDLLIRQMDKKEYCSGADVDFIYFKKPLKEIVEEIIKDLASKDIFSISIEDLLDENIGYQKLWETCCSCFEQIKNIYADATLNFAKEYENIYNSVTSLITGLDYSVLTNSVSALFVYDVLESSTLNKQIKQANKKYKSVISNLTKYNDDKTEQQIDFLLAKTYYPQIMESLCIFTDTLFHKYIAILVNNNKFDLNVISSYDIEHSSNLLQNLSLVKNKENVIQEAFKTCPFNIKVYISAIKNDIIDKNMLKIAKTFYFDKEIIEAFDEYCLLHKLNKEKFNNLKNIVDMLAVYYEKDNKSIYKSIYQNQINKIQNLYSSYFELFNNRSEFVKWIKTHIANTSLDFIKITDEYLKNVVSDTIIKSLYPETIKNLFDNNIIVKEDILPYENEFDSMNTCVSNLILKLTYSILEYKKEVDQYVTKGTLKLKNLKRQCEEIENTLNSQNAELDKLMDELKIQRNTLGFFAFLKKKELDQKLKKLTMEKENNPIKDKYIKCKQEYDEYLKQLEKFK